MKLLTRDSQALRYGLVDLVQLGLGGVGDALAVVVDPPGAVVLAGALLVVGAAKTVCTKWRWGREVECQQRAGI